jgi:hypothetical protein
MLTVTFCLTETWNWWTSGAPARSRRLVTDCHGPAPTSRAISAVRCGPRVQRHDREQYTEESICARFYKPTSCSRPIDA